MRSHENILTILKNQLNYNSMNYSLEKFLKMWIWRNLDASDHNPIHRIEGLKTQKQPR